MVVAELLHWRAPVSLILLCLLLTYNPRLRHKQDCGHVTEDITEVEGSSLTLIPSPLVPFRTLTSWRSLPVARKLVASSGRTELFLWFLQCFGLLCCAQEGHRGAAVDLVANPMVFDLTSDVGFSLALNSVLRLRAGGVLIVALCCESFTVM